MHQCKNCFKRFKLITNMRRHKSRCLNQSQAGPSLALSTNAAPSPSPRQSRQTSHEDLIKRMKRDQSRHIKLTRAKITEGNSVPTIDSDNTIKVTREAAQEISNLSSKAICIVCDRLTRLENCYSSIEREEDGNQHDPDINLQEAPPSSWIHLLTAPGELPMILTGMYDVTTLLVDSHPDRIHNDWKNLLLSTNSVDQHSKAHCCVDCWGSLERNNMPKFAIANGNYRGMISKVDELKDVTEAEWHLLAIGSTHVKMINMFPSTKAPTVVDNASRSFPRRTKVVGHVTVRRSSIRSLAEVLDNMDPVSQPTLVVHLCSGNLDTSEQVQKAIKECQHKVKIDTDRFMKAFEWLKQHNRHYETMADVVTVKSNLTAAIDSTTGGTVQSTFVFTELDSASASRDLVTNASLIGATNSTNSRRSLIQTNETATVIPNELLQQHSAITSSGEFLATWKTHADEKMYPWIYPFGRGGCSEQRNAGVKMSDRVHCSYMLQISDRTAAQCSLFALERYDTITTSSAMGSMCRKVILSTAVQTALNSVTTSELHAAKKHDDNRNIAFRSNQPVPPKPTGCSNAATMVLNTIANSQSGIPGSLKFAKIQRQKAFGMYRHFGNFHLFTTHSPDDLANQAVHNTASPLEHFVPGVDQKQAAAAAAKDPAACAMIYNDTVNILLKTLYGFDTSKHRPTDQDGLFGNVQAFFGVTEEQKRQSLHLHLLTFLDKLPHTCEELLQFFKNEDNVRDFTEYVDQTTQTKHPVANHEMLDIHNAQHICDHLGSMPENLPVLTLHGIPEQYYTISKPMFNLSRPLNVQCSICKKEFSSLSLTLNWALNNCGVEARTAWEAGNYELHGIPIDCKYIFDIPEPPPLNFDSTPDTVVDDSELMTDAELNSFFSYDPNISSSLNLPQSDSNENVGDDNDDESWVVLNPQPIAACSETERAKLCLISIHLNEHSHSHTDSCFKTKQRKKGQETVCRHNKPAKTRQHRDARRAPFLSE